MSAMLFADVNELYQKLFGLQREAVLKVIQWVAEQPHLPTITELEAILFMHSNYYNLKETRTTIENYFTSRTKFRFFEARDILALDMRSTYAVFGIVPLPQKTKEGFKVLLGKFIDTDPKNFSFIDVLKYFTFVTDAWLMEEGPSEGLIFVCDMEGATFKHLVKIASHTKSLKNSFFYVQEALPVRIKGIHLINITPIVNRLIHLMKPFMKKDLWKIFYQHKRIEDVHSLFVSPEIFPSDYPDGKAAIFEDLCEESYYHLILFKEYFLEEERTKRVNEGKRRKNSRITAK